jgi:hypothetical protein
MNWLSALSGRLLSLLRSYTCSFPTLGYALGCILFAAPRLDLGDVLTGE